MNFEAPVTNEQTPFDQGTGPFLRTVYEALMIIVFNILIAAFVTATHLTIFLPSKANQEGLELIRRLSPPLLLVLIVVVAPLAEEAIFRGVPFLIIRGLRNLQSLTEGTYNTIFWLVGGLAAVLFAVVHGLGSPSFHLPLPQFFLGLWSWRVINLRGLRYSILLHAIYNLVPGLTLVFMNKR